MPWMGAGMAAPQGMALQGCGGTVIAATGYYFLTGNYFQAM
jgi:hypothetical protein